MGLNRLTRKLSPTTVKGKCQILYISKPIRSWPLFQCLNSINSFWSWGCKHQVVNPQTYGPTKMILFTTKLVQFCTCICTLSVWIFILFAYICTVCICCRFCHYFSRINTFNGLNSNAKITFKSRTTNKIVTLILCDIWESQARL